MTFLLSQSRRWWCIWLGNQFIGSGIFVQMFIFPETVATAVVARTTACTKLKQAAIKVSPMLVKWSDCSCMCSCSSGGRVRYNKLYWSLRGLCFVRDGGSTLTAFQTDPKAVPSLFYFLAPRFTRASFFSLSFSGSFPGLSNGVPWILLSHPPNVLFPPRHRLCLCQTRRVNFSVRVSSIQENAVCLAAFL